jgi:hypothetical protein
MNDDINFLGKKKKKKKTFKKPKLLMSFYVERERYNTHIYPGSGFIFLEGLTKKNKIRRDKNSSLSFFFRKSGPYIFFLSVEDDKE